MTVKLSDKQIYLRKVVKALEGFLGEHRQIFRYSGENHDFSEHIQADNLKTQMERAMWTAKLILKYIETEKTVFMIEKQDGTLVKADRAQVMKLLSKQNDMTEVIPF